MIVYAYMVNLSTRPNGPGPGARAAGHRPALQRYSGEVRRSHRRSSVDFSWDFSWIFVKEVIT